MDFSIKRRLLNFYIYQQSLILRRIHISRKCCTLTHYEVLGVKESCTVQEIKSAFIEKSKIFHPDKNLQNPKNHKSFVSINEAYTVLSKSHTRSMYDRNLAMNRNAGFTRYGNIETNAPRGPVIFRDESIWEHRNTSQDYQYEGKPYYGIKGVKRLPNSVVLVAILAFATFGVFFHVMLARFANGFTKEQLRKRDYILSKHYISVRARAKSSSTDEQLKFLLTEADAEEKEKTAQEVQPS